LKRDLRFDGWEKVHKKAAKNFKNKNTNFIWSLKNKVLHLHPLREAREVH
jgi:hypothetical protein